MLETLNLKPPCHQRGKSFCWIQVFIQNYFPPIPENQFNFSYVIWKELGKRCLKSQCSEPKSAGNGTFPPPEVHLHLIYFPFLLYDSLSPSLSSPTPIPAFPLLAFWLCMELSVSNSLLLILLCVFFSFLHLSSRQMVNHMVQFCSISVLSYDDSPIIIKSE